MAIPGNGKISELKKLQQSEDKLGNKQEQQLISLCCLCKMCSSRDTLKDPLAKNLGFKEEQTVWGIRGVGGGVIFRHYGSL